MKIHPATGSTNDTYHVAIEGATDSDAIQAYSFAYIDNSEDSGLEVRLTDNIFTNNRDIVLPSGNYTIISYVYDTLGASTR